MLKTGYYIYTFWDMCREKKVKSIASWSDFSRRYEAKYGRKIHLLEAGTLMPDGRYFPLDMEKVLDEKEEVRDR